MNEDLKIENKNLKSENNQLHKSCEYLMDYNIQIDRLKLSLSSIQSNYNSLIKNAKVNHQLHYLLLKTNQFNYNNVRKIKIIQLMIHFNHSFMIHQLTLKYLIILWKIHFIHINLNKNITMIYFLEIFQRIQFVKIKLI